MRFNVSNTLIITVVPHVKIPYADNMLSAFRQKDISYTHIQNTMYRIASKEYVSYFYTKNDVINYYSQFAKHEGVFIPDTTRNTYNFIEFEKDELHSKKPTTLLTKSIRNNKWHIITIDNNETTGDIHVENIGSNANILIYRKGAYIISYYPFYNDIFVILSYTAQQIIINFINMPENKLDSILWNLNDISKVLFGIISNIDEDEKIKQEILDDNMVKIDFVFLIRKQYLHETCLDDTVYLHTFRSEFNIELKGNKYNYEIKELYVYIEMEEDSLKCYWDFSYAYIHIFNKKNSKKPIHTISSCKQYLKNPILFVEKYKINLIKKCTDKSHNKDCYYIKHGQHKYEIIKIGNWLGDCGITCIEDYSLYHYRNYYIMICSCHTFKIAIIDKSNDFIGIMISPEFFPITMRVTTDFKYYHSPLNNKLVFLSNDLVHLFFIETEKIDEIFNRKYKSGCKESYDNELGLVNCFLIPEKLSLAVNKTKTETHENIITGLVGAYIDKKSDKLYIAAEYEIENTKHYGLFIWDMAHNDLNFRLLYEIPFNRVYNKAKNGYQKYAFDMTKLLLWRMETYEFRKTKLINLDIVYNENHRFISMRYNRISRYVPVPNIFQFENYPCEVKTVKNVASDLVVAYYDCSRSYPNSTTNAYHYFVLSSMSLVKKIPTVKI
jgi:hypothetical protein